jgi:hypothetical protein
LREGLSADRSPYANKQVRGACCRKKEPIVPRNGVELQKGEMVLKMKKRNSWGLMSVLLVLVPALAQAGVILSIDDRGADPSVPVASFSGFDLLSLNSQSSTGAFDLHGEYTSTSLIANGQTVSVNFNFLEPVGEPNAGQVSDTLNIVFTGHTPTAGDNNNVSVDLHFRSDADPFGVPGLTNPIILTETGGFQNLSALIQAAGGPADFQVSVASDVVPEPGTLGLLCLGIGALVIGRHRQSEDKRRTDR